MKFQPTTPYITKDAAKFQPVEMIGDSAMQIPDSSLVQLQELCDTSAVNHLSNCNHSALPKAHQNEPMEGLAGMGRGGFVFRVWQLWCKSPSKFFSTQLRPLSCGRSSSSQLLSLPLLVHVFIAQVDLVKP